MKRIPKHLIRAACWKRKDSEQKTDPPFPSRIFRFQLNYKVIYYIKKANGMITLYQDEKKFCLCLQLLLFFSYLWPQLRCSLLDHELYNSPPDCRNRLCRPLLFESQLIMLSKRKKHSFRCTFPFGGELGIRTLGTLRTQHFEFSL